MSERTERLVNEALKAAMTASYSPGSQIEQIIVIVKSTSPGDEDDTAMAVAGLPSEVTPEAAVDSLLTHARIAVERLGGQMTVVGLDEPE